MEESGESIRSGVNVEEQVFGTVHKLTELGLEVIVVIVIAAVCGIGSLYVGKDRVIAAIFALFGAFTLSRHFPYKEAMAASAGEHAGFATLALFVALAILLYLALVRFVSTDFPSSTLFRVSEATVLGIIAASLVMLSLYHVADFETWYDFTDQVDSLFASTNALFWWLVLDTAGLLFVIKR